MTPEVSDATLRQAFLDYQQNNSKEASTIICNKFKQMVFKVAWKYKKCMEIEDAIQNAYMGVLRAAKKYNPDKKRAADFKRSSYNYMKRGAMDFLNRGIGFTIKIGKHSSTQLSFVRKQMELGKDLDLICTEQGWNKRKRKSILNTLMISKTCTIPEEMDIASKRNAEEEIANNEEWDIVCSKIPSMNMEEKTILYMKLEDKTLKEIADKINRCEGTTRQKIKKLYRKIAPKENSNT